MTFELVRENVWKEGQADWVPLSTIEAPFAVAQWDS